MNKSIREKIHGAVFGYAIGDALGLGTEFLTRQVIQRKYPQGLTSFNQIIQDAHRSQWAKGAVTNYTFIMGLLNDSVIECDRPDPIDFARRLHRWSLTDPIDITQALRWVLVQPDFKSSPFEAAKRVNRELMHDEASSDALGRALITGMWNENVKENTREITQITHPQKRCVVAAQVIARMANSILWKGVPSGFGELKEIAESKDSVIVEYIEKARYGSLSDLELDDTESQLLVRKGMGAALWAVWHCQTPEEALISIVNEGGDAGNNAALATALVGLNKGIYSISPKYIEGLLDRTYVEAMAERFSNKIIEKFVNKTDFKP